MLVKIIYELDIDVSDFDPKFIDIPGMAKDLALREMRQTIEDGCLDAEDFEYVLED